MLVILVFFFNKILNICKWKYFVLYCFVLFKIFIECYFGKYVFSFDNCDFLVMYGLFKLCIKKLVILIYYVWVMKWDIYFGLGNYIFEIFKSFEFFICVDYNLRFFFVFCDWLVMINEIVCICVVWFFCKYILVYVIKFYVGRFCFKV